MLLVSGTKGTTQMRAVRGDTIFVQGQPADALFFLLRGKARLSVTTTDGKEAIVASLGAGMFFGEGCLAGQHTRVATATALEECRITRVDRTTMLRLLREEPVIAALFTTRLLARIIRCEADLVDQMFNSSEQRLARMLLLLSHFGESSVSEPVVAGISQEHLAQMVGTTRPRINVFMNRFRKLGYIDYDSDAGLTVHRGLLDVLRD
ncbi:MAG: Crp/Fnr family transcriptional regulator [Vicinamibacterales bacterium]